MILPGFPKPMIKINTGFDPNAPAGTFFAEHGGYYMGVFSSVYALFLAPKSTGQNNSVQWKTSNTATTNTQNMDDGYANLQAMVTAGIAQHPMGNWCRNLTIGGHTDWYPPSFNELDRIYTNRNSIVGADAIDVDASYYWSSTESFPFTNQARVQVFNSGGTTGGDKTNNMRVRAIRRFEL